MVFYFFLCVTTCVWLTLHKKLLNLPKKIFQCLNWMRKNFTPRNFSWSIAAEILDASCFKKGSKHLHHIAIEKNILSELNRCIFQIPLKYIKLVIPKILFILVLWYYSLYWYYTGFNFYFKITWPPSTKIKISDPQPLPAKTSENFNPPSPKLEGGVHALKAQLKLSPLIQNRVQQDYLPESYARHLPSYQKCHKIVAPTRYGLVPPSPEPSWVTLGMGKNPTQ